MNKSRHIKKESMLKALESSLGVVTVACKQTDTPRSTYYKWLKEDEEFAKKRGYIERSELDLSAGDEPIKINVNIKGVEH